VTASPLVVGLAKMHYPCGSLCEVFTMALHLDDEGLDRFAEQAQKILNAPSKTEAIRQALERVVEDGRQTSRNKVGAAAEGTDQRYSGRSQTTWHTNPYFDEKAFLDEMWEK
jgi:antitoxin VapB